MYNFFDTKNIQLNSVGDVLKHTVMHNGTMQSIKLCSLPMEKKKISHKSKEEAGSTFKPCLAFHKGLHVLYALHTVVFHLTP